MISCLPLEFGWDQVLWYAFNYHKMYRHRLFYTLTRGNGIIVNTLKATAALLQTPKTGFGSRGRGCGGSYYCGLSCFTIIMVLSGAIVHADS
jgi:hypothetical protein